MSIEAMKQALEALEVAYGVSLIEDIIPKDAPIKQAITALRTAIEQAEKQEPVVWKEADYDKVLQIIKEMRPAAAAIKDKPASWWLDRFEEAVKQLKEKA
jgi:hypothetical protein